MADLISSGITISFRYGDFATLRGKEWRGNNVVVADSKLFYITAGEIIIKAHGVETVAKAGDIVYIPAGLMHSFYLSGSAFAQKYWMHIAITQGAQNAFAGLSLPLTVKGDGDTQEKFGQAISYAKDNSISGRLKFTALVCDIMSMFISSATVESAPPRDELDEAVLYIKTHPERNLSLEALAERAHLSRTYFAHKFRERYGVPPAQFVNSVRIDMIKSLLVDTDLPVCEIMERMGFLEPSAFSRFFKAATGYSPRLFRKISK